MNMDQGKNSTLAKAYLHSQESPLRRGFGLLSIEGPKVLLTWSPSPRTPPSEFIEE